MLIFFAIREGNRTEMVSRMLRGVEQGLANSNRCYREKGFPAGVRG